MSISTNSGETATYRPNKIRDVKVVLGPDEKVLNPKELTDYYDHNKRIITWCFKRGKSPTNGEGYAYTTVDRRMSRLSRFYRWHWDEVGRYTTSVTQSDTDKFFENLAFSDNYKPESKSKFLKALKMYWKYRASEYGDDKWEPEYSFSSKSTGSNPADYFTVEERQKLRDAALTVDSVPAYNALNPEERNGWKTLLAQRFSKKKSNIGPKDFERANSWKITSLLWVSLDTGLRPVEVERSRLSWIDLDNQVIRIPQAESSKNSNNWTCAIREKTANALRRWLDERKLKPMYDGRKEIWLTREGNPYQCQSLKYQLKKVCDNANIRSKGRSWYSIRHSVGTAIANERDLSAVQAQLRHESVQTSMRYDNVSADEIRGALDKLG